ncbi:MAG TPA: hypothetical protein G4N98_06670 [Thermoflexia bacterium]|nr:hypothetical protein [Thermoflexia bacterium]
MLGMNQLADLVRPRLLADAMLGKLACWLRLLGYDTLYLRGDAALSLTAHAGKAKVRSRRFIAVLHGPEIPTTNPTG